MIRHNSDLFEDANNVIDFVYNMAPHQSGHIISPIGVDSYSHTHDRDKFSGNKMFGVKAAFSSNEKSKGIVGAHSTSSFVKDVGAFLKSFQSSKGNSSQLVGDFVKRMRDEYGINVTVN